MLRRFLDWLGFGPGGSNPPAPGRKPPPPSCVCDYCRYTRGEVETYSGMSHCGPPWHARVTEPGRCATDQQVRLEAAGTAGLSGYPTTWLDVHEWAAAIEQQREDLEALSTIERYDLPEPVVPEPHRFLQLRARISRVSILPNGEISIVLRVGIDDRDRALQLIDRRVVEVVSG